MQKAKEATIAAGTEVTNVCELPFGCWELDLDPMQKQSGL